MVQTFYDELAPYYRLIFADWDASVLRQAGILDEVIRAEWGNTVSTVLDVSCGIGTQAIGLAGMGYRVTASDLSPAAVEQASHESFRRGLDIHFLTADMRTVDSVSPGPFDVLISCDNAIPHLLSDADIREAFKAFYRCLKPGGGCLITVRDYDLEEKTGVQFKPYGLRQKDDTWYFIFQVWEFEGDRYQVSMYFVEDDRKQPARTHVHRTWYYAVSPLHLEALLREAGFRNVHRATCDFYQPVILATR